MKRARKSCRSSEGLPSNSAISQWKKATNTAPTAQTASQIRNGRAKTARKKTVPRLRRRSSSTSSRTGRSLGLGGSAVVTSPAIGGIAQALKSLQEEVLEGEAVALCDLAELDPDRRPENRAGMDEGVELTVLAAGVDAVGQVGEERLVEAAADEGGVELGGIDADEDRFEAGLDELLREGGGVATPEREERSAAGADQPLLAVGADVLEEEVAEGDRRDAVERGRRERARHPLFVGRVDAAGRDRDLHQLDSRRSRLRPQQIASHRVHADPVVVLGDRGQQRHRLDPQLLAQCPQRQGRVLAAAPGEGDGGRLPSHRANLADRAD